VRALWFGLIVAIALAAGLGLRARTTLAAEVDLHAAEFAGAGACARCHPAHVESFARTFHRTMTQDLAAADPERLAPLAGARVDYGGHVTRFEAAGGTTRLWIDELPVEVVRTVGSHRYQQFLGRADDGTLVRLPIGYHFGERRFFHMNEAFLLPDPPGLDAGAPIELADHDRHVTRWNDNCVFCHNVGPSPGLDPERGTFATEVAELGVACEACHGPAGEHAALNADPARRYLLHLGDAPDPSIVNPARLSPERSADACGRCHGQRMADDIEAFLTEGDPFVPGEDLALYSAPLYADTTLGGEEVFRARFWSDGTPRLTAYELQGMIASRCTMEGSLTCTDCHGMHEGDPRGQIRPSRRGAAMCGDCHADLDADHHPRDVPHAGTACTACHMPPIVYGLRGAHVSHRIDVPRPQPIAPGVRPDACVLCHADLDAVRRRVGPAEGALVQLLLGGDPVQRAVAAEALATDARGADAPTVRSWLAEVVRSDPYPAVRAIAWASLRRRSVAPIEAADLDAAGPRAARERALLALGERIGPLAPLAPDWILARTAGRADAVIEIGE